MWGDIHGLWMGPQIGCGPCTLTSRLLLLPKAVPLSSFPTLTALPILSPPREGLLDLPEAGWEAGLAWP